MIRVQFKSITSEFCNLGNRVQRSWVWEEEGIVGFGEKKRAKKKEKKKNIFRKEKINN